MTLSCCADEAPTTGLYHQCSTETMTGKTFNYICSFTIAFVLSTFIRVGVGGKEAISIATGLLVMWLMLEIGHSPH